MPAVNPCSSSFRSFTAWAIPARAASQNGESCCSAAHDPLLRRTCGVTIAYFIPVFETVLNLRATNKQTQQLSSAKVLGRKKRFIAVKPSRSRKVLRMERGCREFLSFAGRRTELCDRSGQEPMQAAVEGVSMITSRRTAINGKAVGGLARVQRARR